MPSVIIYLFFRVECNSMVVSCHWLSHDAIVKSVDQTKAGFLICWPIRADHPEGGHLDPSKHCMTLPVLHCACTHRNDSAKKNILCSPTPIHSTSLSSLHEKTDFLPRKCPLARGRVTLTNFHTVNSKKSNAYTTACR